MTFALSAVRLRWAGGAYGLSKCNGLPKVHVFGRVQVFVDGDGHVVEFGEEARGGFSLTSNYTLDVLAAKVTAPAFY
jgi:hypothetical protein